MSGTVYFIQGVDGGPIKIGYTGGDPQSRLEAIQVHSPVRLRVIQAVDAEPVVEKRLHEALAAHRLHGEWFADHTDVREAVGDPIGVAEASVDLSTFGRRLREARRERGLSQMDVAVAANVRERNLWRWEADENLPAASALISIARVLGVTPEYLMGTAEAAA